MRNWKKYAVIAGVVCVALVLLWLGFSGSGSNQGQGQNKTPTPTEVKWKGTMTLVTDNIVVNFDGKSVKCVTDNLMSPGHFLLRVTNRADQPLVCVVAVKDLTVQGYSPADAKWLEVPPSVPAIGPQKTGIIGVRVQVPSATPDGQYALQVEVSKNGQVYDCPVYFEVSRKVVTSI